MNRQSLNRAVDPMPTFEKKSHKYNASPKTVDGIKFDSTAEAEYYILLKQRQQAGIIKSLILQPRYELQPRTILPDRHTVINAIDYIADFEVTYPDGQVEVIDVKGAVTEAYRIKAKMFKARYPEFSFVAMAKYGGEWMLCEEADKLRREAKKRRLG